MNQQETTLPQIHLKPGELVLTREPMMVVTLLGSCVAVTFFSISPCYAGICHAMLSKPGRQDPGEEWPERFKYLSETIPFMAARFRNLGINTTAIEVKMFGGGNVTPHYASAEGSDRLIGSANIRTARKLLEAENLILRAANVGGQLGRKLIFNTQTGEVMHKHLTRINSLQPL